MTTSTRIDFSSDEILEILQKARDLKKSRLSKQEKRQAIRVEQERILQQEKAFKERSEKRKKKEQKNIKSREKAEHGEAYQWSNRITRPIR